MSQHPVATALHWYRKELRPRGSLSYSPAKIGKGRNLTNQSNSVLPCFQVNAQEKSLYHFDSAQISLLFPCIKLRSVCRAMISALVRRPYLVSHLFPHHAF